MAPVGTINELPMQCKSIAKNWQLVNLAQKLRSLRGMPSDAFARDRRRERDETIRRSSSTCSHAVILRSAALAFSLADW